jgi:hypothetical protein
MLECCCACTCLQSRFHALILYVSLAQTWQQLLAYCVTSAALCPASTPGDQTLSSSHFYLFFLAPLLRHRPGPSSWCAVQLQWQPALPVTWHRNFKLVAPDLLFRCTTDATGLAQAAGVLYNFSGSLLCWDLALQTSELLTPKLFMTCST